MKRVEVVVSDHTYEVVIGSGVLTEDNFEIPKDSTTAVLITEETVDALYGSAIEDLLCASGRVIRLVVSAGEASKDLSVANSLLSRMADLQVRRSDLVVTLGGGVMSDLGGFVASVYMRGLPLIHIPTTLLGQVDAAIGGKTGVNLSEGKNLVGTFHQPRQVLCDIDVIKTLPERELNSGLAEVIKYALCFEPELVSLLLERQAEVKDRDPGLLEVIVGRCAQIKAGIVGSDERDAHRRMVLNYGHTLGHALEALSGYKQMLHGEAISVGMVCAAAIAEAQGSIGRDVVDLHLELLSTFGLPLQADYYIDDAMRFIDMDKKNLAAVRWILLGSEGPEVVEGIDETSVAEAMKAVGGRMR